MKQVPNHLENKMLTVFKTTCSTDWKCRPTHNISIIEKAENQEEAIKWMNKDVHVWMAVDIATEEHNELEESDDDWVLKRIDVLLLKTQDEVKEMWENDERWEMKLDSDEMCRQFVEKTDEDRYTTVYHFIEL